MYDWDGMDDAPTPQAPEQISTLRGTLMFALLLAWLAAAVCFVVVVVAVVWKVLRFILFTL